MDLFIISLVALGASFLTLFSGFGLGTLLMPVVALFFSIEIAIAMTAVVHLANNIFKVSLLGRDTHWGVLWRFGLPAVLAAFLGAWVLSGLVADADVLQYELLGYEGQTTVLNVVVGALILLFVILEFSPSFKRWTLPKVYLPLGGIVSGFFGGLSGHQGAFRSLFLLKAGLTKEEFVATGVMVAVAVDMARILVYGQSFISHAKEIQWPLVIAASVSAFAGALIGKKLLTKMKLQTVHALVAVLLLFVSLSLILGLV